MACLVYSGTIEINCSKDIKVQGIIGPCTSLEKVHLFILRQRPNLYIGGTSIKNICTFFHRKELCVLTQLSVKEIQRHGKCVVSIGILH